MSMMIPEKKAGRRDPKAISTPVKTGGPAFPPFPSDSTKYGLSMLGYFAAHIAAGLAANPELVDLAFANAILAPKPVPQPVAPIALGATEVVGTTEYTFSTKTTEPPNGGTLCFDNINQPSATKIWLHIVDALGADISVALAGIRLGHELYIQDKADSTFEQHYTVSAAAISKGTYYEIPVTFKEGGGALANNTRVIFMILGEPSAKLNAQDIAYIAYTIAAEMVDLRDETAIDPSPVPSEESAVMHAIGPPSATTGQQTFVTIGRAPAPQAD